MVGVKEIINEIESLEDIFLQCRSFFPTLSDNLIGETSFQTAEYYKQKGYKVTIHTGNEITKAFIERYYDIGKWINENAIIRLYGILHYHNYVGQKNKIDDSLPGWEQVRHCCWIRNVITKTRLNYEPETENNVKLKTELISYYGLGQREFRPNEIPFPVDKVVGKIFQGCKKYIQAKNGRKG